MEADYLSGLNEAQKAAVVHEGSPLLILAGAGSGKTRVLTTKIAYLIRERGVNPSSILAVTFTKKAAKEMKNRACAIDSRCAWSQIRTFHSFGAFFLRNFFMQAGLEKNWTVYDDDDTVSLITQCFPNLKKSDASHYAKSIALAKDYCLLPDSPELGTIDSSPFFPEIYSKYQQRLHETGNADFGDLILLPYLVLRDNQNVRAAMHRHFRVIMVDEYQDSNVAQFKLLELLSGVKENSGTYVCVVGDDDQSIYKFRGADIQNILGFNRQFPGTEIIRLETNYRSTQEILNLAENVVRNNSERLGKNLIASRGQGKLPSLVFLPNQDDETEFCAQLIQQEYRKGTPYSDWAILYRTNAQSLGFETEFMHRKIPYVVVGTLKFYQREEIKDIIAWISFLANPKDEISFSRIINKPGRGIGPTSQDKIIAASEGKTLVQGLKECTLSKKASEGAANFISIYESLTAALPESSQDQDTEQENSETMDEIDALVRRIQDASDVELQTRIASESGRETLADFLKAVIEKSGLQEYHREKDDSDGTQKVANMEELVNSAVLYQKSRQGLVDFLDHIELDRTLESEEEEESDAVTLITLHNTKGLEYKKVIITGMENGIFPRDGKDGEEIEEERRLFYVGITRAMNDLFFTSCGVRRLYGRTNPMSPSPFLQELGNEGIRILGQKPFNWRPGISRSEPSPGQISGEPTGHPLEKKWHKGVMLFHDDYGHGEIVKTKVSDDGEFVITVKFETSGLKCFLPEYQGKSLIIEG